MDLIRTPKELKNLRKTGVPYDSKSSAWKIWFETLRKKWDQIPTGASASRNGKRLAGTLQPDPNLLTGAGVTRPMRMGCAARMSWRLSGGHNRWRLLVHEFS